MKKSSFDPAVIRELLDRGLIFLLKYQMLFKQLLLMAEVPLCQRLDFSTARLVEGTLIPPDLRKLESDLIVELTYLSEEGIPVTVYIMQENQSTPDSEMVFRLHCYMVEFWRRISAQNIKEGLKPDPHPVVIPIVFYVGRRNWTMPTLAETMNVPDELKRFVPSFDVISIKLSELSEEMLSSHALGAALKITREADASTEEFAQVVESALSSFRALPEQERQPYEEPVVLYVINVVQQKRGIEEADRLYNIMERALQPVRAGQIQEMAMTTAELYTQRGIEKGLDEGIKKGIDEGSQKGKISQTKHILLQLGSKKYGIPSEQVRLQIEAMDDVLKLEELVNKLDDVQSWEMLLR